MTLLVHILAGGLGLLSGFVALYAAKGATLHRKSGRLFVYAMLTTSVCGMVIAAVRGVAPAINIPAGLLTAYLVVTALTTVRPLATGSSRASSAGGAPDHVVLGVARPHQTLPSRHRRRQRA